MNNNDINPLGREILIAAASKRLGVSPAALKEKLANGEVDELLEKSGQKDKVKTLLSDKKAQEAFLNSPAVKELVKKMKEGK